MYRWLPPGMSLFQLHFSFILCTCENQLVILWRRWPLVVSSDSFHKEFKMHNSLAIPAKRFHLVAFFLLAFALSWSVWIPAALTSRGLLPLQISPMLTSLLGTFGPSLA